ncbi:MAG: carboxypeptidase regulatory-like domain-containing protein [Alistipes sp.]|nr:carboxypeptidase regulatory-like domain-containing protein [Alistipes sp.]
MKRFILSVICVMAATAAIAQNGRVIKGSVYNENREPIAGAIIQARGNSFETKSDGSFMITVPSNTIEVTASAEGYLPLTLEIDGSYMVFDLEVDKKYRAAREKERQAAEKRAAEEAAAKEKARIAAQKQAEAERIAKEKEAVAKAKAEEEARIAAQKQAEAERIAKEKEAAAKAKAEEEARIAAQKQAEAERIAKEKEAAAKAKAEEEARIAAQKQAEAERIAKEKEAAAKAKAEEKARIAAQKQAEAERIAKEKEAAAKAKAEEKARIAAQKQAEAERIAKEKAEIAAAKKKKRDALRIEYAKPIKGYESFVSTSNSMTNNESFIGADYIGGYRFNNIFFLGAGVGANMRLTTPISQIQINEALELSHGAFYFPAYAHFRAQLLNRRCTPFLALSAGYNISLPQSFDLELTKINYNASGAFVNPQFGVTYRIKPKLGIYCAVGFNACMMPECIGNTGYSATIKQSFKYGINVNLGISF